MEKTKETVKRKLRKNYVAACNGYLAELLRMWDISAYNGIWVGGTYIFEDIDYDVNMDDMRYIVENDISEREYMEWLDFCEWAVKFHQPTPNLKAWHNGCPRIDKDTQDKLTNMKRVFEKAIEEAKKKL